MKTRIAVAPAKSQTPVEVKITVAKFKDVLPAKATRGGCQTDFVLKLKKDPRAYLKGDDLYIEPPGAPIRFTLASSPGDKDRYYPLGISFSRDGKGATNDELKLGFANFPRDQLRLEGNSLLILDSYKDATKVRYKFSILVQRGSDGKLGIIDPGIVHEDGGE